MSSPKERMKEYFENKKIEDEIMHKESRERFNFCPEFDKVYKFRKEDGRGINICIRKPGIVPTYISAWKSEPVEKCLLMEYLTIGLDKSFGSVRYFDGIDESHTMAEILWHAFGTDAVDLRELTLVQGE